MRYLVRCVPEREENCKAMQAAIPHLEIIRDRKRHAMVTFYDALAAAGEDAVVHMEDDAVLTSNFCTKIEAEISKRPHEVINFFSRVKDDLTKGARYRAGSSFNYNVCFYLPAGMSRDLLLYGPAWKRHKEHPTGYDLMMQDFFVKYGVDYWQVVPSLVQHAEGRSIINPKRSSQRQSKTFKE